MPRPLDFKNIKLTCGIEIHQQIASHKLFCSCPSLLRDDPPDAMVQRELRAVVGETGRIDVAAAHEAQKGLRFLYEAYSDSTCLVELDEEPPHEMNPEAIEAGLQVSKMLGAKIVDEVQVMRKTVVDGSNTSGFQRTALVARNGLVKTSDGDVGIASICVEEDSAKIMERRDGVVVYRLDRLGIPLIEIGTDPDIHNPKQAQEVAAKLGMILRSTGKVARGLGTIRQDVNVSVAGGDRIEIKGAQDLKMIPVLVEYEVQRQLALLDLAKNIGKHSVNSPGSEVQDVSKLFTASKSKVIRSALQSGGVVKALRVLGMNGLLGMEVQPGRRVGSELSDYAKVSGGVGGLFHSDELPNYGIERPEIDLLRKQLSCKPDDAFILIADAEKKVDKAFTAVLNRLAMIPSGIPKEVRRANPDGTSSFMRPMPGQARMYPETDVLPVRVDASNITIPELLEERKERLKETLELSEDLARDLTTSGRQQLFEQFTSRFTHVKPAFIAETLLSVPKLLRRKYNLDPAKVADKDFETVFDLMNRNKLSKGAIEKVLVEIAQGKKVDYKKYTPLSDEGLEAELRNVLKESEELEFSAVINKAMSSLKDRAEGQRIIEMLKRLKK
ncbi:Glu-tRNA(Gln) amidotransferase subunit GatE [Candidatus Woesearchaeota archaeon]|nr:Glu-tRNA(Gln) amidotransferase subunit GatE [Candidatus Woesearchaeota archaeon]